MRCPSNYVLPVFFAELRACSISKNLERGKFLHRAAIWNGFDSNVCVSNQLIDMYAKCGSLHEANNVFNRMQFHTDVSWNALILGYADNGESLVALDLFSRMTGDGCPPDARSFVAGLKACTFLAEKEGNKARERGKAMHILASSLGCCNIFVENTLVDMYSKFGYMQDAWNVFEGMQHRDIVTWNALILGYADNGEGQMALMLFSRMGSAQDARSFVAALKACTDLAEKESKSGELVKAERGRALHLLALSHGCDTDIYVKNTLMGLYSKCRNMIDARLTFDMMRSRDSVTWTTLISGYAEVGQGNTALDMFSRMGSDGCEADALTFVASLKACISIAAQENNLEGARRRGRAIYVLASSVGCILDLYVQNTFVDMFAKCGSVQEARMVFEGMPTRTMVSWTVLILGYTESGQGEVALNMFPRMEREGCIPDSRAFVAVLRACIDSVVLSEGVAKLQAIEKGKALHILASNSGSDLDIYVQNTLVDMYAKCGRIDSARSVFEEMEVHTTVSWNALIMGYADSEEWSLVLELFTRMKAESFRPDAITCAAALKACGMLGALSFGKSVHVEVCSGGFQGDVVLANILVDFYAKCGSLDDAEKVFEAHTSRELITWNALMAGYSRHGNAQGACCVFDRLVDAGLTPNRVTFLCALKACSHGGLYDKGKDYFDSMSSKYEINPDIEHYTCMIDIFGRAKKLSDAMVLLRTMPLTPNDVTWMTVLGGCRKSQNVHLGKLAFESLTSSEDKIAGPYVIMANLYGSKGMWDDQEGVHAIRKKLRVLKNPGQSLWTDEAGAVHTFSVGDKDHPQYKEIQAKLKDMVAQMREHGYVADLSSVTRNISDLEKEDALCGHSERLAIACALINTVPGETLRIIKNLRVCNDCHIATALISKLEQRTILCRDASRFHIFKDGVCSCGDFW